MSEGRSLPKDETNRGADKPFAGCPDLSSWGAWGHLGRELL